jgi:hypothetical protein
LGDVSPGRLFPGNGPTFWADKIKGYLNTPGKGNVIVLKKPEQFTKGSRKN